MHNCDQCFHWEVILCALFSGSGNIIVIHRWIDFVGYGSVESDFSFVGLLQMIERSPVLCA